MAVATPENPYAGSRRVYNDVNALPLRMLGVQRVIIAALLLCVLTLAGVVTYLVVRLGSQPIYAFGFDRVRVRDARTNAVVTEAAVPINVQPMAGNSEEIHAAAASYWLPLFVESLFSVHDLDASKAQLVRFVRPFVAAGSPAVSAIEDYLSTYNPATRAERGHVLVTADPLPPPRAPNTYHVTWTARSVDPDGRQIGTQTGGALISIIWGKPKPTFERITNGTVIGGNPAGMYVTNIIPDRNMDPRAAGAPNP